MIFIRFTDMQLPGSPGAGHHPMQVTAFIRPGTSARLDLTPVPMRFLIAAGSMGLTEVVSMVVVSTAKVTEDVDNC